MKPTRFFAAALICTLAACAPKVKDHDSNPVKTEPLLDTTGPCPQSMQNQFSNLRAAQDKWYHEHGSPEPTEIDKSQLLMGTNGRAVMVVHGFISAPAAMMDVARALNADGDTVFVPLLTGYGSDANAANVASTDDWRQAVGDGVALLRMCYPSVAVVAHSLGGTIVTDDLLNHGLTGVDNLNLLAPYYKLEQPWPSLLVQAISGGLKDIDVGTLQRQTGMDPYGFLPLQRPRPGEPQPFLPLRAMAKVITLQDTFDNAPSAQTAMPTLLVESEADPVINGGFAAQYLDHYTSELQRITYAKSENIGHSIETPSVNPHFNDLMVALQKHIMGDAGDTPAKTPSPSGDAKFELTNR